MTIWNKNEKEISPSEYEDSIALLKDMREVRKYFQRKMNVSLIGAFRIFFKKSTFAP